MRTHCCAVFIAGVAFSMIFTLGTDSLAAQTRVSGYLQPEWQHYDLRVDPGDRGLYQNTSKNLFTIRRGRIKATHTTEENFRGVVQINATERGVALLDAYLDIPALDSNLLDIRIGRFSKPNFSVLLSSSKREATERAQVIRSLYTGERDIGVMLTTSPEIGGITPTLQFALFNGALGAREFDSFKDVTARLHVPIIDGETSDFAIGGTWYVGGLRLVDDSVVRFVDGNRVVESADANESWPGWGNRNHIGLELQAGIDLLDAGRTVLRGEFLIGQMPSADERSAFAFTEGTIEIDTTIVIDSAGTSVLRDSIILRPGIDTSTVNVSTLALRDQMGYYIELAQPILTNLTAAIRYDYYDRNTGLSGVNATASSDRASSVIGFGLLASFGPVRLTGWYEMPAFDAEEAGKSDVADNKATIRFQYKYK